MGKLAAQVGVSRQTNNNKQNTKAELAKALMLNETDRFVERVNDDVAAHPDDPVEGVTAAFRHSLEAAHANPLLEIALGGQQGGRDDFLPLLTSQPEAVLGRAVDTVAAVFARSYPGVRLTASEWVVVVVVFLWLLFFFLVLFCGLVV